MLRFLTFLFQTNSEACVIVSYSIHTCMNLQHAEDYVGAVASLGRLGFNSTKIK